MKTFYVVDSIMGSGKTSVMQKLLLDGCDYGERHLIVVPLLTEIDRWKDRLENVLGAKPCAPEYKKKNGKLDDLKQLLRHGHHLIIITHALFDRVDDEVAQLIKEKEYSLIIDEVPIPVRRIEMKKCDLFAYIKAGIIQIDSESGQATWNDEFDAMSTSFAEVKDLCKTGKVFFNDNTKALYRINPYELYFSAKRTFILTYMFEAQIIYYYLMQQGATYKKYSVRYDEELKEYTLIDYNDMWNKGKDWSALIKICKNKRMNEIGENRYALGHNWFENNAKKIPVLKKNVHNFNQNICKAKASDVLWTTFSDFREKVEVNGCKKGFLSLNAKATNDFSDRTAVSYIVNRFVSPEIKNYFNIESQFKFNEDAYALSEMLQFIWRSAIRTGKPINLYIPSARMRGLLEKWIEENSVQKS